jgi:transglutaminase/protease-like cytokinesis protein 3
VEFDVDVSKDRRYYIYFMYMFDNPEHFYLSNSLTIFNHGYGRSSIVLHYSVGGDMFCGYGTKIPRLNDELRAAIRAKKATFDAEVARITATIPQNAPDVWKERLIYDRILWDSQYNLGAKWDGKAEDNWTAYGILVNKYGVCESYAEAFQTLCLSVGINCTGVVGTAGGGHKWNCVQLDGEWYMCDITFDDPIGSAPEDAYHHYFNLTSAEMTARDHDWSASDWTVPNCTATKYGFSNYFNESCW